VGKKNLIFKIFKTKLEVYFKQHPYQYQNNPKDKTGIWLILVYFEIGLALYRDWAGQKCASRRRWQVHTPSHWLGWGSHKLFAWTGLELQSSWAAMIIGLLLCAFEAHCKLCYLLCFVGMEFRASHMLDGHSTNELSPNSCFVFNFQSPLEFRNFWIS
jgi:hypothetical protein